MSGIVFKDKKNSAISLKILYAKKMKEINEEIAYLEANKIRGREIGVLKLARKKLNNLIEKENKPKKNSFFL